MENTRNDGEMIYRLLSEIDRLRALNESLQRQLLDAETRRLLVTATEM